MSGWDKAPEYGGGGKWGTLASILGALIFSAVIVWLVLTNAPAP